MELLRAVFRDVLPLFVTIDAVGSVPIFLALTRGMTPPQRRTITFEAVAGATCIAIGFMFVGDALFRFLGITITDFQIAGGVLLLVLSINFLFLLFVLFVLLSASRIARLVGVKGLGAISKLVMVLLSAIAVSFIREGVTNAVLDTISRVRH